MCYFSQLSIVGWEQLSLGGHHSPWVGEEWWHGAGGSGALQHTRGD